MTLRWKCRHYYREGEQRTLQYFEPDPELAAQGGEWPDSWRYTGEWCEQAQRWGYWIDVPEFWP